MHFFPSIDCGRLQECAVVDRILLIGAWVSIRVSRETIVYVIPNHIGFQASGTTTVCLQLDAERKKNEFSKG